MMAIKPTLIVTFVVVILLVAAAPLMAQEVTLTSKAKPIYLGANGGIFYDGPAPQTDLFLKWKNGVYADVWTSTALNTRRDFDKEVDFTLGKSGKVGKMDYDLSASWFLIIVPDVINLNGDFGRSFNAGKRTKLGPFARAEVYFPAKKGGPRHGLMSIGGARGSTKITDRLALEYVGWIKRDSGCFGFDPALLAQGRISAPISVTPHFRIVPGITLSKPFTSVRDGRKREAVWEVGFSYRF